MPAEEFAQAKTDTIAEFLRGGILTIPDLQRPFAWSTTEAGELLDDITQYLQHGAHDYYFLGSVIFFANSDGRVVVDGQQRLATITVLLCVIRDEIESRLTAAGLPLTTSVNVLGKAYHVEEILRIIQAGLKEPSLDGQFLLRLRDSDKDRLGWVQEKPASRSSKRPHGQGSPRLYRVFEYYRAEIAKLAASKGLDALAQVAVVLLEKLAVTRIKVKDLLSAYTIFSRINIRGKDLTLGDILRATVLAKWHSLMGGAGQFEAVLLPLSEIDDLDYDDVPHFLRRYWILKTGRKYSPAETQNAILQTIESCSTAQELQTLVKGIGESARVYRQYLEIIDKGGNNELERRIAILGMSKLQQQIPAILAILGRDDLNAVENEAVRFLALVEAIHVNHNIIGNGSPSDLEDMFAMIAPLCKGPLATARGGLIAEFQRVMSSDHADLQATQGFESRFAQSSIGDAAAHFILRRLELSNWVSGELVTDIAKPSSVHLEHILPQNPKVGDWDAKWTNDEDLLSQNVSKPGNLTLLKDRLNKGAKNRAFVKKRDEFYQKSEIRLNEELKTASGWDEAAINDRSVRLAKQAAELWGWPKVSASS